MISVEAIEAVATRLYPGWQNSPADWQDYFRRKATEALEAAAPHMLAAAWDEGDRNGADGIYEPNPYRTARNV